MLPAQSFDEHLLVTMDGQDELQHYADAEARAERLMRALRYVRRRHKQITALCAAEVAEITAFYDEQLAELDRRAQRIEDLLISYAAYWHARDPRHNKTLKLAAGDIVCRAAQEWQHDDEGLLAWATENGRDDLVEVTRKLRWGEAKKLFTPAEDGTVIDTTTGEIVPHVHVNFTTRYTVKVRGEEEADQ